MEITKREISELCEKAVAYGYAKREMEEKLGKKEE